MPGEILAISNRVISILHKALTVSGSPSLSDRCCDAIS
jgi:hypothetical protein